MQFIAPQHKRGREGEEGRKRGQGPLVEKEEEKRRRRKRRKMKSRRERRRRRKRRTIKRSREVR